MLRVVMLCIHCQLDLDTGDHATCGPMLGNIVDTIKAWLEDRHEAGQAIKDLLADDEVFDLAQDIRFGLFSEDVR
jgi:hypothetical protein